MRHSRRRLETLGVSLGLLALTAGCGPRTYQTGTGLTRSGIPRQAILVAEITWDVYRPTDYPIPLTGEGCFLFWYDTDTSPVHDFTLSIDGLVMGGETIDVPELRFERGTVTAIGGFP